VTTLDEVAAQLAALAARVGALEGKASPQPAPAPTPGKPGKPTGLACAIGPDGRPDLRWDPAAGVTAWELHDLANTVKTLQATVTEPRSIRSKLQPGQHRRYAVLAIGPGGRSDMSDPLDVPPASAPTPAPTPVPPSVRYPADVCGKGWYLTLPIAGPKGSAKEIHQPELATYADKYFSLTPAGDGMIFRAWHGGVTTSGSPNPRSELRECNADGSLASWSCAKGHHRIVVEGQVNRLTKVRPHVVCAQIHGASNDVTVFRREGSQLWITNGNDNHAYLVDGNLAIGQRYSIGFDVTNGTISYLYNGSLLPFTLKSSDPGSYFKAGCYAQTNPTSAAGESTDEWDEVVVFSVAVTHAVAA
jgi:hypothetical protein